MSSHSNESCPGCGTAASLAGRRGLFPGCLLQMAICQRDDEPADVESTASGMCGGY
jgi:hypothetical protein